MRGAGCRFRGERYVALGRWRRRDFFLLILQTAEIGCYRSPGWRCEPNAQPGSDRTRPYCGVLSVRLFGRTWAARSMKLCAINDRPGRWVLLNQSGKLSSKGGRLLGGRGKTLGTIDLHVASRVRERRIGLGISQRQLASALGLTFQQLHKYEQGKSRISAGRLYELGKVLGVPITFFFEDIADTLTPITPTSWAVVKPANSLLHTAPYQTHCYV